jgi:hypothetical protein
MFESLTKFKSKPSYLLGEGNITKMSLVSVVCLFFAKLLETCVNK